MHKAEQQAAVFPALSPLLLKGTILKIDYRHERLLIELTNGFHQRIIFLPDEPAALRLHIELNGGQLHGGGLVTDDLAADDKDVKAHRARPLHAVRSRFKVEMIGILADVDLTGLKKKQPQKKHVVDVIVPHHDALVISTLEQRKGMPVEINLTRGFIHCVMHMTDFPKIHASPGRHVILHGNKMDLIDDDFPAQKKKPAKKLKR